MEYPGFWRAPAPPQRDYPYMTVSNITAGTVGALTSGDTVAP